MHNRWRPNNRVTYHKWKDCDRCALPWPEDQLRRQRGALVCPECFDSPCHEDHVAAQEATAPSEGVSKPWVPDK